VLQDAKQPAVVRWRLLWALRVHHLDLLKYDTLFTAMKNVLTEPALKKETSTGSKMLRYDCAYLLGVLKRQEAPEEVLPVLQDFLFDDHIRIFTGISASAGGTSSETKKTDSKGTVIEQ